MSASSEKREMPPEGEGVLLADVTVDAPKAGEKPMSLDEIKKAAIKAGTKKGPQFGGGADGDTGGFMPKLRVSEQVRVYQKDHKVNKKEALDSLVKEWHHEDQMNVNYFIHLIFHDKHKEAFVEGEEPTLNADDFLHRLVHYLEHLHPEDFGVKWVARGHGHHGHHDHGDYQIDMGAHAGKDDKITAQLARTAFDKNPVQVAQFLDQFRLHPMQFAEDIFGKSAYFRLDKDGDGNFSAKEVSDYFQAIGEDKIRDDRRKVRCQVHTDSIVGNSNWKFWVGKTSTVNFWTGSLQDHGFWAGNFMFIQGLVKLARFAVMAQEGSANHSILAMGVTEATLFCVAGLSLTVDRMNSRFKMMHAWRERLFRFYSVMAKAGYKFQKLE